MMDAATNRVAFQIAPSGLVDTKWAASYLGIKPDTLTQWRSSGRRKLPYVKCGGQVRYRLKDLDAFIEANLKCAT